MNKERYSIYSIIFLLIFNLSVNSNLYCQTDKEKKLNINGNIGFNAGFTTGLGLSAKIKFDSFYFQFVHGKIDWWGLESTSVGTSAGYYFIEDKEFRGFIFAGYHYYRSLLHRNESDNSGKADILGAGVGLEILSGKRFLFNLDGGFGYHMTYNNYSPTIELGAHYLIF